MQLKSQFEYEVVTGHIPPGGKLPSVREVARVLQTSPVTVTHAYRELEAAGLVVSQPGAGFFVLGSDESQTAPHARVRRLAATFLEQSVREGVSLEQALQILLVEINEAWARAARTELIVVCKEEGRREELAMHLRHSLLDLRIEVESASLEEVAADLDGWLPRLRSAQHVLCLAFDLRELRSLLADRNVGVIPIIGTLREDIHERLVDLAPGTKVVIIASSAEFVDGMISAVLSLNPIVTIVGGVSCDDRADIPELLAAADCVVYGTLARRALAEYLPVVAETIELVYVPESGWTERFRKLIQTEVGA